MRRSSETKKRLGKRRSAARIGRPPQGLAGEIEMRILDAAQRVFLERGLAGASIEEIAGIARTAKTSIYARFPSKEALFTTAVIRNVAANIARFEDHVPTGATIEERLADVGIALLHWALIDDNVDLMRLAIAEARRFPDLAGSVHRMARERGTEGVARLLKEATQSDALGKAPAFTPECLTATAQFFLDLVFLPLMTRALFGEKLKSLPAEIESHVVRSVVLFLAACRRGGVN
ncbi:TetR/AcrR family transcriptional regulator [Bradyrhizobium liaoningense]|uniref:TetR/AcrR family transcriptional regulator n=1 Tax=Bradyrhizobium liaoningense TaxID=43992 RepID=UPI001BA46C72|nr:TetR/AcrR family transcriptional regulator [Bradyrhizobium liaoningense]MBR0706995.1 TetR/AcrR family transcriptional regulator [Bradyrhizobium liaoningense]